ncbi:MAG: ABC transporter permease subunit [Eubacteriales bacterium]|nr:ABC transporter permease subunit [Eubacteriales bacterium]
MNRLLHAGMYRLRKNKVFFASLFIPAFYSVCVMVSQYLPMKQSGADYAPDTFLFQFLILTGLTMSVFISLYVGTDYHDGTLRNKLIGGLSRNCVYLSNFLLTCLVGILSVLFAYLVGAGVGISFFGMFEMPPEQLILTGIVGVLLNVAYISVFNMISMLSSSKTNSAVDCILLGLVMIIAASMIFSKLSQPEWIDQALIQNGKTTMETVKNPRYVTGMTRAIYQNIIDFLPSGQAVQILNQEDIHAGKMIAYAICIILGTNIAGLQIFKRKDIK